MMPSSKLTNPHYKRLRKVSNSLIESSLERKQSFAATRKVVYSAWDTASASFVSAPIDLTGEKNPATMASGLGNYMMKSVGPSRTGAASPAAQLYRAIAKEVPRVLTIYDIDMDFAQVSAPLFESGRGTDFVRLCWWSCFLVVMCSFLTQSRGSGLCSTAFPLNAASTSTALSTLHTYDVIDTYRRLEYGMPGSVRPSPYETLVHESACGTVVPG